MRLKRIVMCIAVTGVTLAAGAARSEQRILPLQRGEAVSVCSTTNSLAKPGGTITSCKRIASANHGASTFSKDVGTQPINPAADTQAKAEMEAARDQWVDNNSFIVYTKDEVYSKGETYPRSDIYNRVEVDGFVTQVKAEIEAKLAAIKISSADKDVIVKEVASTLQPKLDMMREEMTQEITQTIRDELKAAGVLQ